MIGAAVGERGCLVCGSVVQHDHEPAWVEPVGQQAKHLERRCICPMEILDHQEDRGSRQPPFEKRPYREMDLALELLGLDLAWPGLDRAEPDHMVEGGHELSALARRQPKL